MPGRHRSFDRDQALELARDAFWRAGYDQVSISQLTAAMGINPPSLYAAFGDKQRLFTEAAGLYVGDLDAALHECLAAPTARAAISELLRRTAEAHGDPRTPPGCLVLSEPRLADERTRIRGQVAERVRRGQREGDVDAAVDADEIAAFVEAVTLGMSARARDGAGRSELLATARRAAAAALE